MLKKWISLAFVTVLSVSALTACTDNEKIKQTVQQSLIKQNEMKSYQFAGSAGLSLSDTLLSSPNPLTNSLLTLLREGTIDWKGTAGTDPVQFETDLQVTPKGASTSIAIPILIKDSKLYFNMPAISKPDEYYVVDLAQISKNSKSPLTPDSLKNTSQVTSALSTLLFTGIDAKWFKEAKDPVKLKDGASAKYISIDITSKNEKEITTYLQSKLPEFISILQTNGLMAAEQAEKMKNGVGKSLQIQSPSKLSIAIDDQGFIRDQVFDLHFSVTADNGKASSNQLTLHQTLDNINQPPVFTKEVPKNTKSFEDVMKLLSAPNKTSK
jgi:hypothetical protein